MDFSLSEEQKQIKALVREFCQREVDQKRIIEILRKNDVAKMTMDGAKAIEEIQANYPHDLREKAHKAGLLTIGVPTKYGGPGPDTDQAMTLTIANEEAGYSAAHAAWFLIGPKFIPQAMRVNPYITEETREKGYSALLKYSPQILAATISEPGDRLGGTSTDIHWPYDEGGSSVKKIRASREGNGWVINGDGMFSNEGAIASNLSILARTKEGPISESITSFQIPADTPGISRTLNKLIFTDFGGNCQYHYDNVRVPESAMQGQLHMAWKPWVFCFPFKWQLRSHAVGMLQRLYENMYDFAKERVAGGKPIIQHSSCAARLGELALRLESLRALQYKVAWETDQMEKAVAKGVSCPPNANWYWYASLMASIKEVSWQFCETAHNIYGSIATEQEMPLDWFVRYTLMYRGAALPPDMELARICKDYDTRYYYETYEE